MITSLSTDRAPGWPGKRGRKAFTFTEVMVASAIFVVVVAGVVSSHIFGLKMLEFTQTRQGANDVSRKALSLLTAEIWSAKSLRIGNVSNSTFVEVSAYVAQQGTAIQIYPTNNTTNYIRYYLDTNDSKLKRQASSPTNITVIAESLKTTNIFTSEDYAGNIASNRQSTFVLGVMLQFFQLNNPTILISTTNYFNSYTVQMKACVRSAD